MARYRVNPNAICSSKNYKQSKKLHMDMLKRNHEVFMEMVIKEEIVIKRQAYIKVYGSNTIHSGFGIPCHNPLHYI